MDSLTEHQCLHCRNAYVPTAKRQLYCSKVCKQRAQNKRYYWRNAEAERQRLNEANKRRRTKDQRRDAIVRSLKPLSPRQRTGRDEVETALRHIMQRLNLTRGQAIARAIRELAASLD